ncbi:hypothetical protein BKA70DRAFT_1246446 [Coprinopsis sp. MPI-PUGE-AT-0042]|nr:hypothetical protein BKA70DRAFT_1246446 [Coprinopsis sp. MPI-PUGE-AT-0042]
MDIWGHIAPYIDPPDLISLRKTCQVLYDFSQRRFLWLDAAKTTCADYGLLTQSFPFENMSDMDLEHLALSPTRFEAKILRQATTGRPTLQPFQRRIIATSLDNQVVSSVDTVHLLPGGRYLLICLSGKGIYVWDLGYNVNVTPKAKPAIFIENSDDLVFHAAWPDARGFRIFFYSAKVEGHVRRHILHLWQLDVDPQTGLQASRRIRGWRPTLKSIQAVPWGNLIAVATHDSMIYVVNGEDDNPSFSWVGWNTTSKIQSVAIHEKTILSFEEDGILIYDLPSQVDTTVSSHRPRLSLRLPPGRQVAFETTSQPVGRRLGSILCALLSSNHTVDGFAPNASVYAYALEATHNSRLPQHIPVEIGSFVHDQGHPGRERLRYKEGGRLHRTASGIFLSAFSPKGQVFILRYPISDTPSDKTTATCAVALGDALPTNHFNRFDLCCATGRMVVVRTPSGGAKMEIEVIDFLNSPSAQ